MLFTLSKYVKVQHSNSILRATKPHTYILSVSSFYRKNYFRSLMLFFNLYIVNVGLTPSQDFFYMWRFVSTYLGPNVWLLYFKKLTIK